MNSLESFYKEIINYSCTDLIFNQYKDSCPEKDNSKNYLQRRKNLKWYLEAQLLNKPKVMIIGESAGYNGAKINGLHLIHPDYLLKLIEVFGSGYTDIIHKDIKPSMTSKIICDELISLDHIPLTFNIIPFYLKTSFGWTKNRTPSKIEARELSIYSKMMYEIYQPKVVLSVGRMAQYGLNYQKIPNIYLRHPSMGGKDKFIKEFNIIIRGMNENRCNR